MWTQLVVLATMSLALTITAQVMGPSLFRQHMNEASHPQPDVLAHAEQAFHDAGASALGVGLLVAVMIAAVNAWVLNRSLIRGLDALAKGALQVARGNYDMPVTMPPAGAELERVAQEFNRMAAQIAATETTRRQMLTDLSHELRTPLAATRVTLESLEDGVVTYGPEVLDVLHRQNQRLTALAADISEVSRAEEGRIPLQLKVTSLDRVAHVSVAAFRDSYRDAEVDMIEDLDCTADVDVDAARLGQVLDNLLRNALQYTPAGGCVRVRTRRRGGMAIVEVSDNGAGVPAEALPHLFERFYHDGSSRVRDTDSGTGVGLTIARAIARAHAGDLTAASDGPGTGARFTLALPIHS